MSGENNGQADPQMTKMTQMNEQAKGTIQNLFVAQLVIAKVRDCLPQTAGGAGHGAKVVQVPKVHAEALERAVNILRGLCLPVKLKIVGVADNAYIGLSIAWPAAATAVETVSEDAMAGGYTPPSMPRGEAEAT